MTDVRLYVAKTKAFRSWSCLCFFWLSRISNKESITKDEEMGPSHGACGSH